MIQKEEANTSQGLFAESMSIQWNYLLTERKEINFLLKRYPSNTVEIEEIIKLSEDPEYGQQFVECYIDHLNVLSEVSNRSHDNYLQAVKFFSLVENGDTLTDAYIKVFPERYQQRVTRYGDEGTEAKDAIRGEASRYNRTKLLNEIRKVFK